MKNTQEWVERFPGLSQLEESIKRTLQSQSKLVSVPEGEIIFGSEKVSEKMLFLLEGKIRVQQVSSGGHEIVLYRIHAGQSCVLTTACLLTYEGYSASGVCETPVLAAAVPKQVFNNLVAQSDSFREFVFAAFSRRIIDLFEVINEVAFQKLDVRLAAKLIDLSYGQNTVSTTHQKLSIELGTAREVISRQLQDFQRRGWIEKKRGVIKLIEKSKLQELAHHNN